MSEPIWLTVEAIVDLHAEQLSLFGGPGEIRDRGLLESAIDRPRNRWTYDVKDLAALAASYAFGLAKNHPFVDGNKRATFVALMVFLRLNEVRFAPDASQATAAIQDLAAGDLTEDELAHWIKDNWPS